MKFCHCNHRNQNFHHCRPTLVVRFRNKKLGPRAEIDGACLILTSPLSKVNGSKLTLTTCVIKGNGSITIDDEDTEVSSLFTIMIVCKFGKQ